MLVFDLVSLAEACALTFFLWPPLLCRPATAGEVLARRRGKAEVLVFDLAVVAKALVQFEHSLEVLVFDLDASPKAIVQFEKATEAIVHMLERCLRLCLDECHVAFGHARAAALPLNMVDARLY
jgi:DNA primase